MLARWLLATQAEHEAFASSPALQKTELQLPSPPAVEGPSRFLSAETAQRILSRRPETNALLQELFLST